MSNYLNIFHKISDSIEVISESIKKDDVDTLTGLGILSGAFKARFKSNRNGISNAKSTFVFDDDVVNDYGIDKVSYKDNSANSIFGDSENSRLKASGNKKYDYFDDNGQKIAVLTVEEEYVDEFDAGDLINGFFEADIDDSSIIISTNNGKHFDDTKIMTVDFTSRWI